MPINSTSAVWNFMTLDELDKQHTPGLMNLEGSVSHMPVILIFSQNTLKFINI